MTNRMKAFEIATCPCSGEYAKNQSIIRPAFDLLTGPEGPSRLTEWVQYGCKSGLQISYKRYRIFYRIDVGKLNAYAVLNTRH